MRIIPHSDEEHRLDEDTLAHFEKSAETFEETGWLEMASHYEQAIKWYVELEETHAKLQEMTEERDYYHKKCRDEGIY